MQLYVQFRMNACNFYSNLHCIHIYKIAVYRGEVGHMLLYSLQ